MQLPLLFLGDSPSLPSGLGRIGKDLACLATNMGNFRVGFLGRGGIPSRHLPFMQYTFDEHRMWGQDYLESVWKDFAGNEAGILFTIWDPSRLLWLTNPKMMPNEEWLERAPFVKWGYFPVDAAGPAGRLTTISTAVIRGYQRVIAYGAYGGAVIENSIGRKVEWMPHGISLKTFNPKDAKGTRGVGFKMKEGEVLVGCNMTNQLRKDWGLAFEVIGVLRQRGMRVKAWFKVDVPLRHWDLKSLVADYNMQDVVTVDDYLYNDEQLAYIYSACDVTMLPSLGEGFGYPIVESLACGVPCLHGNYAGGAELVGEKEWLVDPVSWRLDAAANNVRPVYDPRTWADAVEMAVNTHPKCQETVEKCVTMVEHLDWPRLGVQWEKLLREGLGRE